MNRRILALASAAALVLAAVPARAQQPAAGGLAVQVAPHAYVVTEQGAQPGADRRRRGRWWRACRSPRWWRRRGRHSTALHAAARALRGADGRPRRRGLRGRGMGSGGALALAHEGLRWASSAAPPRCGDPLPAGARVPSMGYSEVVQVLMGQGRGAPGEAARRRHRRRRGGPLRARGGALPEQLHHGRLPGDRRGRGGHAGRADQTVDAFTNNFAEAPQAIEPIVPARGPLATSQDWRLPRHADRRARQRGRAARRGEDGGEAVAAQPTAQFDARWGRGPVSPERFVRAAYAAILKEREAEAAEHQHSH